MIKLNNTLLVSALLFTLTACGGGTSTGISEEAKKDSIAKISNYASNSSVKPVEQDYINAGVDTADLAYVDIDELNTLVASKNPSQVNSEEELQDLAQSIMDTTPPVIRLSGHDVVSVTLNTTYNDKGATAFDDKDGTVNVTSSSNVNISKVGNYTVTYRAEDKVGNKSENTRIVNVVLDKAPVITVSETSIKERGDLKSLVTVSDEDDNIEVVVSGNTDTTVTGIHHIIYTVTDSAKHTVTKAVDVNVIPFTVHELITKGQSGELDDVSYHVIGDSTRNYPDAGLTILVDKDNSYYKKKLTQNIEFSYTAMSGQRVEYWLRDDKSGNHFKKSESFKIIDATKNSKHCIVEFSMGINDLIHDYHLSNEELKSKIKQSISELQNHGVHVLLVSPVPYFEATKYRPATSADLNNIYEELKSEPNISFVSGYNAMLDGYPSNTIGDNLHPNNNGSKHLADVIFSHIENDDL